MIKNDEDYLIRRTYTNYGGSGMKNNETKKYTREELINICELAIVNEEDWEDRDTESSQENVGICWALLKCGCDFEVRYNKKYNTDRCVTDEETIWLDVYSKGFGYFEYSDGNEEDDRKYKKEILIYLPTMKRLAKTKGKDWY